MGRKINLSSSRFGSDASNHLPGESQESAVATPKNHISALKRIGRPNAVSQDASAASDTPSKSATSFMVTVTNDRNTQGPERGQTMKPTGRVNPVSASGGPFSLRAKPALAQVNDAQAGSSIEIIDLDAEPEATPIVRQQPQNKNQIIRKSAPAQSGMGGRMSMNSNQRYSKPLNFSHSKAATEPSGNDLSSLGNRKRKQPPMGVSKEDSRILAGLAAPAEDKPALSGGRRKLFVANFPKEGVKEADIKELFEKFGKVEEIWMNMDKCFGFVKMDTKLNAEKAKLELDRSPFKGRNLNVRLASQSSMIKVTNLGDGVTNELLRDAFEAFGELEHVCVACDYHLKPLGYGFVEFSNKKRAEMAVRKISEHPFVLTKSVKPICVKPLEDTDEEDGLSLKSLRPTAQLMQELSERPRFLEEGTFEHDVAMKWKMQYLFEERQREHLEQQLSESRERLQIEIEDMYKNHKAWVLREELKRRQVELERLEKFKSQDNFLESKRADLDRAAQLREDQFRREEEMFMQHQEQLRRNAEVHLVQQIASQESQPQMEVQYGGGGFSRRSTAGPSMGSNFFDQDYEPPRKTYTTQELMMGNGGAVGGSRSLEYGAAANVLQARSMAMRGGGSAISNRLGGPQGSSVFADHQNEFDIPPMRRQQTHF